MDPLSNEERKFLAEHGISLDEIYNAWGLPVKRFKELMEIENKSFAYNTTPCDRAGHQLRTRAGHCIQCNPARIRFQKRFDSDGNIYIAHSDYLMRSKVGYTQNIEGRKKSLNRTRYGDTNDWEILYGLFTPTAGKMESLLKSWLIDYNDSKHYMHDGHLQVASEIYRLPPSEIKQFILSYLSTHEEDHTTILDRI